MQIIRALGTEVTVYVNDELVGLKMRLGKAGEAYFYEEEEPDEEREESVTIEKTKSVPNFLEKKNPLFLQRLEEVNCLDDFVYNFCVFFPPRRQRETN